ncbi:MAG TPA: hypothetical protein VJS69_14170 [Candidatus Krumholzibacteria bacterium]|nr:hypothetical protein [Candidatus Krumholzibacteria bacterium]
MKRVLLCTLAVLMLASLAFAAGETMTPQQAMEKVMNCPVCSAWNPVAQNIRYDIFTTKNGTIETFMNAGADQATWDACSADCEKRMAGVATMSADQKAKLCPFCMAHMNLMSAKDVTIQNYKAHTGWVTTTAWNNPAGQKAVTDYATSMKNTSQLLETAAMSMKPAETQKGKM